LAFEGTPLSIAMRDCGLKSFVICGIATEIGIEPTVRHGADLGLIPIVVTDACGGGDDEAAARALAGLHHMGDAMLCKSTTWLLSGVKSRRNGFLEARFGEGCGPAQNGNSVMNSRPNTS
jgi:nicotinamidase-related amidase